MPHPSTAWRGWIESLTPEVAPFGIRTMIIEPGFFRTELLTEESTNYAEPSIDDYTERTKQTVAAVTAADLGLFAPTRDQHRMGVEPDQQLCEAKPKQLPFDKQLSWDPFAA